MSVVKADRRLPWWKKALFSLVVLTAFFVLLELGLAAVGVPPLTDVEDPFAGFSSRVPHFRESTSDSGEIEVRLAATKRHHFHDLRFLARKPAGVKRVFCLGGSTTYGRPFWDETSFAGWLRALLPREDPSTTWEILNAGGISYASYRIVGVMRELAAYDPDLFIVYTGQNEFLEYRTYKDLIDAAPFFKDSAAILSRTRLATVMRRLFGSAKGSGHQASELPDLRAVDSVGPDAYTRDDQLAEQVAVSFEAALDEMVGIAKGAGARILFVVPASNLADFAPLKSEHAAGLSPSARQQFARARGQAKLATSRGRHPEALVHLSRAEALDDRHAALLYEKARVLTALERHDEAAAYYVRAKDEDVVSLRAVSRIAAVLRRVGARDGVGLLDFEAQAAANAPHGVPGDELLADHVHLKILGNRLLAVGIATWLLERVPTESTVRAATAEVMGAVDRPRYAAELLKLARMLEWMRQVDSAIRRVQEALELVPDDFEARLRLAGLELKRGRPQRASAHFELARQARPRSARVYAGLGAAAAASGRPDDALAHLEKSIELDPELPLVREHLAVLLSELGRVSDAVPHFEAVVRLTPDSAQAHSNLGLAYAKTGKPAQAERAYQQALKLDARCLPAHFNYGLLLEAQGRSAEALQHCRAALDINPRHAGARECLARLQRGAPQ